MTTADIVAIDTVHVRGLGLGPDPVTALSVQKLQDTQTKARNGKRVRARM